MELLADVWRWFTDPAQWQGRSSIPVHLWQHVRLSGVSMVLALVVALPVGVVLGHVRRGGVLAVNVSNIGRAVPSFALLVLAFGAFGIGTTPAYVALVALAVPPVLTNAYVGVAEVDAQIRESAVAMGMRGREVLRRIELPLAVPLIMAGVRTAAVQVVATATLADLVGGGGLGRYIILGLRTRDNVVAFGGALLVALLAVLTELLLGRAQRRLTPRGIRGDEIVVPQGSSTPRAADVPVA